MKEYEKCSIGHFSKSDVFQLITCIAKSVSSLFPGLWSHKASETSRNACLVLIPSHTQLTRIPAHLSPLLSLTQFHCLFSLLRNMVSCDDGFMYFLHWLTSNLHFLGD